ncbi:MAG: caspase family protein [Alphaproteobacteria bacterium]|nr:caspase family protein [Alphaproteobacteria bacterium]
MSGDHWVDAAVEGPASHALVVGVSSYLHLPGGDDPSEVGEGFALGQLSCAAVSAHRVARWLQGTYRPPVGQLASLHVLLAPSPAEVAVGVAPSDQLPDRSAVEDALFAWKARCDADPAHTGILYLAGHGVQLTRDGGVLLLHDFGRPNRNLFHGAVDLGAVLDGMARPGTASTQFYFFDACRQRPAVARRYDRFEGALGFDAPAGRGAASQPAFFSTAEDTVSYGQAATGTLFVQSLLECLDGPAVHPPDDTFDGFGVRVGSLWEALHPAMARRAAEVGVVQEPVLGGVPGAPAMLHRVDGAATVQVNVAPDPARGVCTASLRDAEDLEVHGATPCEPDPSWDVREGIYRVVVDVPAGSAWVGRSRIVTATPGTTLRVAADVGGGG